MKKYIKQPKNIHKICDIYQKPVLKNDTFILHCWFWGCFKFNKTYQLLFMSKLFYSAIYLIFVIEDITFN